MMYLYDPRYDDTKPLSLWESFLEWLFDKIYTPTP